MFLINPLNRWSIVMSYSITFELQTQDFSTFGVNIQLLSSRRWLERVMKLLPDGNPHVMNEIPPGWYCAVLFDRKTNPPPGQAWPLFSPPQDTTKDSFPSKMFMIKVEDQGLAFKINQHLTPSVTPPHSQATWYYMSQ